MKTARSLLPSTPFLLALAILSCDPGESVDTQNDLKMCEGCHVSQEALQQYASEPPPTSGTEGGG